MNLARAVRISGDGGQEGRHLAPKKQSQAEGSTRPRGRTNARHLDLRRSRSGRGVDLEKSISQQSPSNLAPVLRRCKLLQFFFPRTRFLHLHTKPRTRKLCTANLEQVQRERKRGVKPRTGMEVASRRDSRKTIAC